MRLLVYTTLFPNCTEEHHGVFVKERLAHFRDRTGADIAVVAPVPLAPPLGPARWTRYRAIPSEEKIDGFLVLHPRYLSPPGFGDSWRAALMARGTRACLMAVARRFGPDVLDVHYAYPDGSAARRLRPRLERALGRRLPLVLTARGTDLNLMPGLRGVRAEIARTLGDADHVVCVAEALRTVALEMGSDPGRTSTLRNGVDTGRFTPQNGDGARVRLGLPTSDRLVLCVGHLIERKGQHLLLEALARVPEPLLLVLVGQGEREAALREQARGLGLAERVRFCGAVPPARLADYYRAADVMILASLREGWPNVVLESLACGTPVIATRVWGTPEILEGCAAGLLVEPTVDGLADGLARMNTLDPTAARPWAERHTWDATVEGLVGVFKRVGAA